MTTVRIPAIEAMVAGLRRWGRRSTFPLGPHFTDPGERAMLARALRNGRREVLSSPAECARWARGYHVRLAADRALRWSHPDLVSRVWRCPLWRGRPATGYEAQELATDGQIKG